MKRDDMDFAELRPIRNADSGQAPRQAPKSDSHAGDAIDAMVARAKRFRENFEAEPVEFPNNIVLWCLDHLGLIFAVLVTMTYLAFEASWNLGLVRAVGSKTPDKDALNALITEGRILAAFGLTWAIAKSEFTRRRGLHGHVLNTAIIGLCVFALYVGIGKGYDAAIDAVPAAESLASWKVAAHRAATGMEPISAVMLPIVLADPKASAVLDTDYDAQRSKAAAAIQAHAAPAWSKLVEAKAKLAAMANSEYDAKALAAKFDAAYEAFTAGSKRAETSIGKAAAASEVLAQSGNIAPNSLLDKASFAQALTQARYTTERDLGNWWLETAGGQSVENMNPVVYSDTATGATGISIRYNEVANLDHAGFTALIEHKAGPYVSTMIPTVATVKANELNHAMVAAVILPPMAMTLSLMAVVANLGSLLGLLLSPVPVFGRHQMAFPVAALVVGITLAPHARLVGLESSQAHLAQTNSILEIVVSKAAGLEHVLQSVVGNAGNNSPGSTK